jgi:hypothetical protein
MRLPLIAALASAALLAAGCGGGSSAPSKAEYSKNIARVCAQIEKQTNQAAQGAPNTPQQIAAYADRLSKVLDKGVQSVDNVQRPDGKDGEKAKAYVDELRKQVDTELKPALNDLKTAAQKNDKAGVQAAAARIRSIDSSKTKNLARAAGANGCAS